ncbi:MAG: hypothetical protein ACFCUE_00380 [Candidatus Bathyarchaeia archaeon]|jgi:hypothetical protein
MAEHIEVSSDSIGKIKQAANQFKETLIEYFKENNVEIKDWKVGVENSEGSYVIDASVKIKISPKK